MVSGGGWGVAFFGGVFWAVDGVGVDEVGVDKVGVDGD